LIRNNPGIGIVRGGIAPLVPGAVRRNSFQLKDVLFPAGKGALTAFALGNNYFSGTVYNKKLLTDLGLLVTMEKNLPLHRDYPHLYIEALACAVTDVALSSAISCFEGEPQPVADSGFPSLYLPAYTLGCRMDQFIVLRNSLYEAVGMLGNPFDAQLFRDLYIKHCAKYFRMVGRANAQMYANNFIDVGVAVRAFAYFSIAAMIRIEECAPYKDAMMREIDRLAREYGG
jgi:hypothetical protein